MGDTIVLNDTSFNSPSSSDSETELDSSAIAVKSEPSDFEDDPIDEKPSVPTSDTDDVKPIKEEDVKPKDAVERKLSKSEQRRRTRDKLAKDQLARVKPDVALDRDRERKLLRIATQGWLFLY